MSVKVFKLNNNISTLSSMSQTYMCTFQHKATAVCNGISLTDVFTINLCVKTTKQFLINLCQTLHGSTSTRTYKKNKSSFSSDQYVYIIHYICTGISYWDTLTRTNKALQAAGVYFNNYFKSRDMPSAFAQCSA